VATDSAAVAALPGTVPADRAPAGEVGKETEAIPSRDELLVTLNERLTKLRSLQGERPLILPSVDEQAVASVVADWTRIPVGRMVKNEVEAVLKLADTLSARVIGQRHGLEMIARR